VSTVQVDLFDLTGKRVLARQLPLQDGRLYSVLSLGDEVASGIYMVNVTAGDFTTTERLVIQR
jgi:5-hydroxyisourate hydrolase-like protein (transthyretin family)